MTQDNYRYRIFDCVLRSSIALPELPPFIGTIHPGTNLLSFILKDFPPTHKQVPQWFHHWYLPEGRVSISCGRIKDTYHLRFPQLADFEISVADNTIICFPADGVEDFAIRHLLLDQVIPRLLSHQGQLILHASGVSFNNKALLFLGETGQGKSTLAMALQQQGLPLLTDDCVRMKFTDFQANCIPNYVGARLWPDSVAALKQQHNKQERLGSKGKSRFYFSSEQNSPNLALPVKAVFFLSTLNESHPTTCCSITPVTGSEKFIEMNKHCFPLDITDQTATRNQFQNMERLGKTPNILFAKLYYTKDYTFLPELCKTILAACADHLTPNSTLKL